MGKILKIIDSTDNRLGNLSKLKSKQTEKFKVQIDTIWSVVELEIQPIPTWNILLIHVCSISYRSWATQTKDEVYF